ncbi:MAG TPA: hypothetical protein PKA62_04450, partial [Thermoanaerobaculia bacterium]|nr:hypothetical protein [Thermoanaerobaculia bacterium]
MCGGGPARRPRPIARLACVAAAALWLALPAPAQEPEAGAARAAIEPAALPPEVRLLASGETPPPAAIPPFLDLNDLSAATWGGAVSAAKEAMRLVAGPMSPEEEAAFDETWKPLFRFPHEKLVDWLNALNPLLGQYLATRASAGEAVLGFDATQLEAAAAAAAGDAAAVEEAMESAALQEKLVASLVARLEETVREIEALGPPPDPDEEQRRRKKRHEDAFRLFDDFPLEGEWVDEDGSVTQVKLLKRFPDGKVVFWSGPKTALEKAAAAGIDTSRPGVSYSEKSKGMVLMPGIYDLIFAAEPLSDGRYLAVSWILCPNVTAYRVDGDEAEITGFQLQCLAGGGIGPRPAPRQRRPPRSDAIGP